MTRRPWRGAGLFGAALLAGCATYRARPLPTAPDWSPLGALVVPAARLQVPGLPPHPFDPSQPLDELTVVTLAVVNNPELKAARAQAGVAAAQVLAAGLLPDPVATGALSRSAVRSGYSAGVAEEVQALITLAPRRAAARAQARQVNLELLWQEWQVAERARELFLQANANVELLPVAAEVRDLQERRRRAAQAAFDQGDCTADRLAAAVTAANGAGAQLDALRLAANETGHALNALLGLRPDEPVRLASAAPVRPMTAEAFRTALAASPARRADLLALQAGYESEEERLRAAVLAQFPALSVGVEQGRSAEEGVHTTGFTIDVTLPLFSRNRGPVAQEKATRAALRQAYQSRLDQAANQADAVWRATQIMAGRQAAMDRALPALRATAAAADVSFARGELTLDAYLAVRIEYLAADAEAIRLRAAAAQADAALRTLLGLAPGGGESP